MVGGITVVECGVGVEKKLAEVATFGGTGRPLCTVCALKKKNKKIEKICEFLSFLARRNAEESYFSIELGGATTCCVLLFGVDVFMNRKPGLADDRSWSLSCDGPRKCDRPKGHNLFISIECE